MQSFMNQHIMGKFRVRMVIVWSITCLICLLFASHQLSVAMVTVKASKHSAPTLPSSTSSSPVGNRPSAGNLTSAPIPRPPTMVLTSTNGGLCRMTLNLMESIKRTTPNANVTVIAEDEPCYIHLTNRSEFYLGMKIQKTHLGFNPTSQKLLTGTKMYSKFLRKRARYILQFLESGVEVLFSDYDTYWVKDPFKDFKGEFDFAAHNEDKSPKRPLFSAGFAYFRPTENTLRLVREWVQLLDAKDRYTADQIVFNRLISEEIKKKVSSLKIKTLDPNHYPDGRLDYRIPGWKEPSYDEISVVHLSYIRGYNAKVQKLRHLGWWLVWN